MEALPIELRGVERGRLSGINEVRMKRGERREASVALELGFSSGRGGVEKTRGRRAEQ